MKLESVAGKRVLVTGAAMGLGKLFAEHAVREGADAVVLWDVNELALRETAAQLTAQGGKVHHYVVDVSSQDAIREAAEAVRSWSNTSVAWAKPIHALWASAAYPPNISATFLVDSFDRLTSGVPAAMLRLLDCLIV